MAKPKQDNRDIFDKALDAAPIVGGVAGTLLGHRLGRGLRRRGGRVATSKADSLTIGGAMTGYLGTSIATNEMKNHQKKRRKK